MIYLCPKCDKGLASSELEAGQCENCKIHFNILGLEKTLDEDLFMKKFRADIDKHTRNKKLINYHDSIVNMLKAVLKDVVIVRRAKFTAFYLIEDAEVRLFLFSVMTLTRDASIEFDVPVKGEDVIDLRKTNDKLKRRGFLSRLHSRDFTRILDVCCDVYNKKKANTASYRRKFNCEQIGKKFID